MADAKATRGTWYMLQRPLLWACAALLGTVCMGFAAETYRGNVASISDAHLAAGLWRHDAADLPIAVHGVIDTAP